MCVHTFLVRSPSVYSSVATLTQKQEECRTFPAQQHLFAFLVNSRGGSGVMSWMYEGDGGKSWLLTGRVGPIGVRAGVGGRAVVPQRGVALTAVGWWDRDGAPKLTVRTCRGAEGTCAWNKPAAYWLHRVGEDIMGTYCMRTTSLPGVDKMNHFSVILTLGVSWLLVVIYIFFDVFVVTSAELKRFNNVFFHILKPSTKPLCVFLPFLCIEEGLCKRIVLYFKSSYLKIKHTIKRHH